MQGLGNNDERKVVMLDEVTPVDPVIANGINVTEYEEIVRAVRDEPALAKFEFRASNRWEDGGYNETSIAGFYGAGDEQGAQDRHFTIAADEPPVLLGTDRAPNPVEFLLHALAGCLTSAIVYKAATKGIRIETIESTLEGDLDASRFLELSDEGRLGFQGIRAAFKIKADAPAEEIRALAEFSPVLDVVRNGTSVTIEIKKV
jgi:uncharacterized OsmC-like protein